MMVKQTVLFFLILFGANELQAQQTKPLTIGEIRVVKSAILNEDRILNIYLPEKYDANKAYPVMYVLDGSINEDFLHIMGLVQFFNMQFKMPDFIVVGIANIDRKRDFTFHTDLKDLQKDYPTTGHSDQFIRFVEAELQPFIQKTYKTNDTKYIIGQSLGGLLATEILLKKPQLFTHYLIVSPSLWWDDESLLKQAKSLLDNQKDMPLYVYISVGKGEHKTMLKDAEDFRDILLQSKNKNLKVDYKLMVDDNHATILHNSIYQGLLKLFPYKE